VGKIGTNSQNKIYRISNIDDLADSIAQVGLLHNLVVEPMSGDILAGLWNGIKEAVPAMLAGIGDVCKSIFGAVKKFFGINSPSTVFAGIGRFMAQGLGVGFGDMMKSVSRDIAAAVPTKIPAPKFDPGDWDFPDFPTPSFVGAGRAVSKHDRPANVAHDSDGGSVINNVINVQTVPRTMRELNDEAAAAARRMAWKV
jgi:hypothetical protein